MRELHWHATAAEWAFVLNGRVRTTLINPVGQTETNDFEPGDIWYFPRGHPHVLECLGNEPTHFILIFDNGYFSEFGTFSITDWIGHAPKSLLAKNFGLPESAFDGFPTKEVYFARGAIPPEKIPENLQGPRIAPPQTHKFRMLSEAPTEYLKVAANGASIRHDFQFQRQSRASFSTSNLAHSASCTGTLTQTNGNMLSRATSA